MLLRLGLEPVVKLCAFLESAVTGSTRRLPGQSTYVSGHFDRGVCGVGHNNKGVRDRDVDSD